MPVRQNEAANGQAEQTAGIWAGAMALGAFISDMDGFCARNPQSCETGKSLFGTLADHAGQGAALAYQWLGASLHKGAENTRQHLNTAETTNSAAAPPVNAPAEAKAAAAPAQAKQDDIAALVKADAAAKPAKPAEPLKKQPPKPAPAKAAAKQPAKAAKPAPAKAAKPARPGQKPKPKQAAPGRQRGAAAEHKQPPRPGRLQ